MSEASDKSSAGLQLRVFRNEPHACPYLPGRTATEIFFAAEQLDDALYEVLMNHRFRRSGQIVYQPNCDGCQACVPIRVPVAEFRPSRSQRRVWTRNADLRVEIGPPTCDGQRVELLNRYEAAVHQRPGSKSRAEYEASFGWSPLTTIEMSYWLAERLVGVGIVDVTPQTLSSVYFFYEPELSRRSLGVFSALREIEECRRRGLAYWYIGFHVLGCAKMTYKEAFRPHELLMDGVWRAGMRDA